MKTVLMTVLSLLAPAALQAQIELVSRDSLGVLGNGASRWPALSADGRWVAFSSAATNLVPGDTNGKEDIFLRDTLNGTTQLVSLSTAGAQGDGNSNLYSSVSGDGRFVAFGSLATNLVPGDTNGKMDVFVRDTWLGTTERVSVASGGAQVNGTAHLPTLSHDGRYVAFMSTSLELVPGYGFSGGIGMGYLHDRQTGTTEALSVGSGGVNPNAGAGWLHLSADGRYAAFESYSTNLVPGDTNNDRDVFLRDRLLGTTERVSVNAAGVEGNKGSSQPRVSGDGRYVSFSSTANNLTPDPDLASSSDTFLKDRWTGQVVRTSSPYGPPSLYGNGSSNSARVSADGRCVAFYSTSSNLVVGDVNGTADYFVYDVATGLTACLSRAEDGTFGNGYTGFGDISGDGEWVVFETPASNLVPGDTNGVIDVFRNDVEVAGAVNYCTAGTSASGCQAALTASGAASATAASGFVVSAASVEGQKDGLFFFGANGRQANPWGNGTSYQCVVPPVKRSGLLIGNGTSGACDGLLAQDLNALWCPSCPKPAKNPGAGALVQLQCWYRDPLSSSNQTTSLSNALEFALLP